MVLGIMAKSLKAPAKASRPEKGPSKELSLYPLDLATALGAALRTGPPPENEEKRQAPKVWSLQSEHRLSGR